MYLCGLDPKLPPCFKVWCDCGWTSRVISGAGYTVGIMEPIDTTPFGIGVVCACGNRQLYRKIQPEDFKAHYKYVIDKMWSKFTRDKEVFPCICTVPAPLSVVGNIEIRTTVCGDTCFCSDLAWLKITSEVKCNGCYAKGRVAWIENIPANEFYKEEWTAKFDYRGIYREEN